jgi:uncharacterized protein YjbJ (UPF0337 family)
VDGVRSTVAKSSLGDAKSSLGDAKSSLGDAKSSLGDAKSLLGDAKSSLGDAKSSLGDAKSTLGDAKSSLGDAKSTLGDAKSSLGDAKSLLGDAKSSLGDTQSSQGDANISLGDAYRYALLYESMLDTVLWARDHYLKPGGALLPDTATIFMAGVSKAGTSLPFWDDVYGFDMCNVGEQLHESALRTAVSVPSRLNMTFGLGGMRAAI